MENNNILRESQHGFQKKKSTTSLIAQLYERIAREKGTDRKNMVTVVLRDISKAFDKVWHDGLRYKLMQIGLNSEITRILSNFLQNRKG